MINFRDYEVFIFDCDGVILNSNSLKTNAFRYALRDENPIAVNQLIQFHKENGGVSRYEKFKYFYTELNTCKEKDKKIAEALKAFADVVSREMLEVETIPGVISFLDRLKSLNKKVYVNSGSDEEELKKVFEARKLTNYFEEIYGSPSNKFENIIKIKNRHTKEYKSIFFGDSSSDYEASKKFNIDFVFISGVSEWNSPAQTIETELVDFTDALKY
jgi:phosphoglycolate phosphatase-like HAD superfamily hydrolase